ncbi:MAG: hypothetical protein IPK80_01420 [Nannocystis sp.]|nr:hypothetical protein [Nannocystis sp.]
MKRSLHEIGNHAFEQLIGRLCVHLLGAGTKVFSSGPDGGIDASFEGQAEAWPSSTAQWAGRWIVQAKHTENPAAAVSDSTFSSDGASSVISEEIAKLTANGGPRCDHYLLYTNRRGTPQAIASIEERLKADLGVQNAQVVTAPMLDGLLSKYPAALVQPLAEAFAMPLTLDVDTVAAALEVLIGELGSRSTSRAKASKIQRTSLATKNALNAVGSELDHVYNAALHEDLGVMERFLAAPDRHTDGLRDAYLSFCDSAKDQLVLARTQSVPLAGFLVQLIRRVCENHEFLSTGQGPRAVRAMVYYMYWICDLGTHADSDET